MFRMLMKQLRSSLLLRNWDILEFFARRELYDDLSQLLGLHAEQYSAVFP